MLVVISPAKKLDMSVVTGTNATSPAMQEAANELASYARKLRPEGLRKLMGISKDLAKLNADRFASFSTTSTEENAKQAALAFAGDTYQGLEAATLSADEMRWAQEHLRILSGLYGVLRPLDRIQPYRLEMGSRLKTRSGKNLYDYWGDRLSLALNEQAAAQDADTLVNCASQEYFGAVDLDALSPRVITPVFMEEKAGTAKIVSFFAKRARGAMARYIIQNRISDTEAIKGFDTGGYKFQPSMSGADRLVFLRDYPSVG